MRELHVRDGVSEFRATESAEEVVELGEHVAIVRFTAEQADHLNDFDPGGWEGAGEDVAGNVLAGGGGGALQQRFFACRQTDLEVLRFGSHAPKIVPDDRFVNTYVMTNRDASRRARLRDRRAALQRIPC